MNAIHVNSASAAASVFISIIFAVGSVKSITGKLSDAVLTNIPYGSVLLVFSLATLIACEYSFYFGGKLVDSNQVVCLLLEIMKTYYC